MSQDSKVFFRIFFGIGLVLILISVVIFYNQFTYSKDAIHTKASLLIPSGTPVILIARVKMVRGIPSLPFVRRQITR